MPRPYQGVTFAGSFPRATAAAVRRAENDLGVAFPDDYRAFLRAVNGGVPTPGEFAVAEPRRPGARLCVDVLYGVAAARGENDLAHEQRRIAGRVDALPDGFVAVGFDPGAAPYFLAATGPRAGAVYFYDPSGFLDPDGSPGLHVAAASFSDLLARLAAGALPVAPSPGGRRGPS